jgi:hypothetical protein
VVLVMCSCWFLGYAHELFDEIFVREKDVAVRVFVLIPDPVCYKSLLVTCCWIYGSCLCMRRVVLLLCFEVPNLVLSFNSFSIAMWTLSS